MDPVRIILITFMCMNSYYIYASLPCSLGIIYTIISQWIKFFLNVIWLQK